MTRLTTAHAATIARRPRITIQTWIKRGWLNAEKIWTPRGYYYLIAPADLDRIIAHPPQRGRKSRKTAA